MGARKDQLFGIQSSHQQGVNNVTCVVRSGQNLSINSFKNENQMRLCLAHLVWLSVRAAKTENSIRWQHGRIQREPNGRKLTQMCFRPNELHRSRLVLFLCFWNFFFYTYCGRECVVILNCVAHKCCGARTGGRANKSFYGFFSQNSKGRMTSHTYSTVGQKIWDALSAFNGEYI